MAAYPGSALPLAAGLRSVRLKHDSPMIHMRRGRRLEIAFVSYWEWAKLVATSLGLSLSTTAAAFLLWWWLTK